MKRYGLIGRPLGHSFSAGYFAAKFRREGITGCDYALYELPSIEALPELLGAQPELQGFNVTIPYKQRIFDYLDDVSEEATRIGAVNCVRRDGGRLTGFNTDIEGIRLSLRLLLGDDLFGQLQNLCGGLRVECRRMLVQQQRSFAGGAVCARGGGNPLCGRFARSGTGELPLRRSEARDRCRTPADRQRYAGGDVSTCRRSAAAALRGADGGALPVRSGL